MIVSRRGGFCFFHNPKVGGASVHKALEAWHDVPERLGGLNPERTRWMSHLGVDEFAGQFPDLWTWVRDVRLFALWRDPYGRFLSAVYQYSKSHADTEVRFLPQEAQRRFVLSLIERLDAAGSAEAMMERVEDTFFRPQWIYLRSERHDVAVEAWPLENVEAMYRAIEEHVGAALVRHRINSREQYDLPRVLAAPLASSRVTGLLRRLPGAARAKRLLAQRYGAGAGRPFGLNDAEIAEVRRFVDRFYARDRKVLSELGGRPDGATTDARL